MSDRLQLPVALLAIALVALPLALAAAVQPVFAVAGVVAIVLGVLTIFRADVVLLLLVAALPWEDALAPPASPLPVVKLLGALVMAAWAIRLALGREPLRLPPVLISTAAFTFAVGTSLLFSPDQPAGLVKVTSYVSFIVFFFVVVQLIRDLDRARLVLIVLSLSTAAAAARGLFSFLVLGIDRASGPIEDPNGYAYVLATVLPLTGYLIVTERRRRWVWVACFVLIAGAIAASLSRGAFVGLAAVALWALASGRFTLRNALIGSTAAVVAAAAIVALLTPDIGKRLEQKERFGAKNVSSRQAFWRGALSMAADRPLTGVGPGRFGTEAQFYVRRNPVVLRNPVVHNSYLEILAESGIVALGAFLAFLAAIWRLLTQGRARARSNGDRDASRLASSLQATMLVAVVSGAFISAQLITPFWLLGGLAAVFAASAHGAYAPARAREWPAAAAIGPR